ncbi:MAG: phytanoyl-CoA dioxygenase family protein [Gammaproteobacteria bacterium]|nr:phytanoyl-CoA dioxygenase family protein [Gammaproteobacteria bacterium]
MNGLDVAQLRADFRRDGYVILPGFLNAEELTELDTRIEAFLDTGNIREAMKSKAKFAGTIKGLDRKDEWFSALLNQGKPAQMVSQLLEDDLDTGTAALFDRIPGEDEGIQPHFDSLGHRRDGATLWIALDHTSTENGCLYYAKGSHKQKYESVVGLPNFDESTPGAMPVQLKPGDAAVHSSLTVHWSNPNQSERSRRGVTFFYWAASSKGEKGWLDYKKQASMAKKQASFAKKTARNSESP